MRTHSIKAHTITLLITIAIIVANIMFGINTRQAHAASRDITQGLGGDSSVTINGHQVSSIKNMYTRADLIQKIKPGDNVIIAYDFTHSPIPMFELDFDIKENRYAQRTDIADSRSIRQRLNIKLNGNSNSNNMAWGSGNPDIDNGQYGKEVTFTDEAGKELHLRIGYTTLYSKNLQKTPYTISFTVPNHTWEIRFITASGAQWILSSQEYWTEQDDQLKDLEHPLQVGIYGQNDYSQPCAQGQTITLHPHSSYSHGYMFNAIPIDIPGSNKFYHYALPIYIGEPGDALTFNKATPQNSVRSLSLYVTPYTISSEIFMPDNRPWLARVNYNIRGAESTGSWIVRHFDTQQATAPDETTQTMRVGYDEVSSGGTDMLNTDFGGAYRIVGWNTKPDGTGTSYQLLPGTDPSTNITRTQITITKSHPTVDLYPMWQRLEWNQTVKYHFQGGSIKAVNTQQVTRNEFTDSWTMNVNTVYHAGDIANHGSGWSTFTITPPAGQKFVSWNTKPDGTGTSYKMGDQIPLDKPAIDSTVSSMPDVNLYAQWKTAFKATTLPSAGGNDHTIIYILTGLLLAGIVTTAGIIVRRKAQK